MLSLQSSAGHLSKIDNWGFYWKLYTYRIFSLRL